METVRETKCGPASKMMPGSMDVSLCSAKINT